MYNIIINSKYAIADEPQIASPPPKKTHKIFFLDTNSFKNKKFYYLHLNVYFGHLTRDKYDENKNVRVKRADW